MLSDPDDTCFANSINLCEVFFGALRASDEKRTRRAIIDLHKAGVINRRDLNRKFIESVWRINACGRISLADCFGIALAQKLGGEIITSDHHEFDSLVPLEVVPSADGSAATSGNGQVKVSSMPGTPLTRPPQKPGR